MQDPSSGVSQGLLNHVHLISHFSFPYTPAPLHLEQALDWLLRAPQIVRDAPVSWQYLHSPPDGKIYLAWQPTNQLGTQFATDGYIWAGSESSVTKDVRGYTVEVFVNESGFTPQIEQIASHRRVRYRLISSHNNAQVDSSLELVHYTASAPENRIPARAVPPNPQIQKSITERRYLEQHGPLSKKEFMLHDRNNWPQVQMPGAQQTPYQQAGMYGRTNVVGFGRGGPQFPGQPQVMRPNQGGPAPQNKRGQPPFARGPGGPGAPPPNPFGPQGGGDDFLRDEENPTYGDVLDFLTPREMSVARYEQHHEWMEEILSSVYSTNQILPVNLGLRLEGELAELTDGLWRDGRGDTEKDGISTDTARNTLVNSDQVEEFEKRVADFVRKGDEQLAEMKRSHEKKMSDISQQKLFARLERRLAEAPLDTEPEDVVIEAENATNAKVTSREDAVCVQKGGMLNVGEENVAPSNDDFDDFTNMDTAGEALDFYDNMDYTS